MEAGVREYMFKLRHGQPIRTDPETESDFISCIESYRATCERIRENHKNSRSEQSKLRMELDDAIRERDYYKKMLSGRHKEASEEAAKAEAEKLSKECDKALIELKNKFDLRVKRIKKDKYQPKIVYRDKDANRSSNLEFRCKYLEEELIKEKTILNKCIDDCFHWEKYVEHMKGLLREAERILLLEGKEKTWNETRPTP